ncbi:L-fucose-proton symporter [Commensalibacter sp. Nvir]|uniref:sugar MFS transporter n=1 Tax=Commensalibacter sp. Nvir TaxID=3069817 RepID=UPI002D2EAC50|nr:L-fucose-proton symporter [Commensalibacter sp. Nvir]
MSNQPSSNILQHTTKPLIIVGILFFVIGFFTWINGPLIPFVKVAFTLNDFNAFFILFAFYISFFIFSLPASWVLKKTGMKNGLSIALLVMAIGALIFGQFIKFHWYLGVLIGLFVIGIGLACLQTAVNPYVSILGPIEKGAQRQAMMGICNKGAGILAPIIFGLFVTNIGGIQNSINAATSAAEKMGIISAFANKVYYPYMGMAVILLLVAFAIYRSNLPEIKNEDDGQQNRSKGGIPTSPRLWFGVLCIFVYVGIEVLAGSVIGTYGEGFHLPVDTTKFFTSFTLIAMLIGYFAGIIITPKILSQESYLVVSNLLGIIFAVGAWLTTGYTSVTFIALLGFANSMMWPAIFPIAIRGLGEQTASGSALMIMGICGGAIIPEIYSYYIEFLNFQTVFVGIAIICYVCMGCYGIYGYLDLKRSKTAHSLFIKKNV